MVISANSNCRHGNRYYMYMCYYRQYPAYYMPLILCYWKMLHNTWYALSINIDIIKSNNVPVCFVADEVLSDGTQQHSTGRGVCYIKLMNKTSWQELFWQISGALVAALCHYMIRYWNWFGFTIKITTVVLYSSYLPRPNPEGTSEVWVLTMCVFLCVCLECNVRLDSNLI